MEENENKDPMYPETSADGDGDGGGLPEGSSVAPDAINNTPEVLTAPNTVGDVTPDIEAEIAKDLGGDTKKEETSEVVNPSTALPFDFSTLTKEQLQSLKSMLDATPDGRARKVEKPKIRLRKVDDKIIEDFKNAINALVDDPENQRKVYRHLIPVKFFGEEKYVNMPYDEFINAEQVECEVQSQRKEIRENIIGIVFSRQLGRDIEAVERKTTRWYTIKLPSGETVELSSKVINA